jgi:hypothetical protein
MEEIKTGPKLTSIIQSLVDNSNLFPERYLTFFSDIAPSDLNEVKKVWPKIPLGRKISLIEDMESMMIADTRLCFEEFVKFALTDDFPEVRGSAIGLLWESENPSFIRLLVNLLENDESEFVQIASAEALGRFVLLGELEEIPSSAFKRTINALILKINSSPTKALHQELLKSLSYSSIPEVMPMIEAAFENSDPTWQLAAIISMGRSADDHWKKTIIKMIECDDNPQIRTEAVKAAGELELASAQTLLLNILDEQTDDPELRLNLIWALSKIGGTAVKSALEQLLEETGDDEETEALELALEALGFSTGLPNIDL